MILIIDDDEQTAQGLERFFRFEGLDVRSVLSGHEAFIMLHVQTPRLIILDMNMPVMDGMTLLRRIRDDPSYDDVPILMYTSEDSPLMRMEAINAGAQDFLTKTFTDWHVLLERVKELLGGSSLLAETAS